MFFREQPRCRFLSLGLEPVGSFTQNRPRAAGCSVEIQPRCWGFLRYRARGPKGPRARYLKKPCSGVVFLRTPLALVPFLIVPRLPRCRYLHPLGPHTPFAAGADSSCLNGPVPGSSYGGYCIGFGQRRLPIPVLRPGQARRQFSRCGGHCRMPLREGHRRSAHAYY